jgi:hypothetical protein
MFNKGDFVIGQNFIVSIHRNGMEGQVIAEGPINSSLITDGSAVVAEYAVAWADGAVTTCDRHNLRKPKDPGRDAHLRDCKPYDKSYEDVIKELGHVTEETVKRTMANMERYSGS